MRDGLPAWRHGTVVSDVVRRCHTDSNCEGRFQAPDSLRLLSPARTAFAQSAAGSLFTAFFGFGTTINDY
jgi:hypothetical protein